QVFRTHSDVENVPRSNAWRIAIAIGCALSRYLQLRCAKIPRIARFDSAVGSSPDRTAEETDSRLFRGCERQRVLQARHITRYESAVVSPRECGPRAIFLQLITHIRGLLKRLVMVDSKNATISCEESRPIVSHRCVPLKAFEISR